jgi:hypothetical protein
MAPPVSFDCEDRKLPHLNPLAGLSRLQPRQEYQHSKGWTSTVVVGHALVESEGREFSSKPKGA